MQCIFEKRLEKPYAQRSRFYRISPTTIDLIHIDVWGMPEYTTSLVGNQYRSMSHLFVCETLTNIDFQSEDSHFKKVFPNQNA